MNNTAIYAGSFDPMTNGHAWMIKEGAQIFDKLIIVVAQNANKKNWLKAEDRVTTIKSHCFANGLENVEVVILDNQFLADYAVERNVPYLLRGIRNVVDFEYERDLAYLNQRIVEPELKTIFLMTPKRLGELSSSMVRAMVGLKDWYSRVAEMVPDTVYRLIICEHGNAK
jgi:pantetheine-phosphate adenylyltransferase